MKSETFSPSEIVALRGTRSRAEFAACLGVTALTIYRWELAADSPEARRPRGKVLERLHALALSEGKNRTEASIHPPVSANALQGDDILLLDVAMAAIDDAQLDRAEHTLVELVNSGKLQGQEGRALAVILLSRLHLLSRHDVKSAFSTLLGVGEEIVHWSGRVQLEFHITAAFLHAHADAQLFNPGKTHHHAALADQLLDYGNGGHRFFLWYARYIAAVTAFELALMARAFEQLPMVKDLAVCDFHRCLVAETQAISSLNLTNTVQAHRCLDELRTAVWERGLPMQRLRVLTWQAELLFEEGAPPEQVLALLEQAEELQRQYRIAKGIHLMFLLRAKGECLLRLGQHARAEAALLEALKLGHEISYTPIRLHTALARWYLRSGRIDDIERIAHDARRADDVQKEMTRTAGKLLALLVDVLRGDASSDFCATAVGLLAELSRLSVWPVAHRHLALLVLAVAAPRSSLHDVETLMTVAQRSIELSATASATASYRRQRAIWLMRRGKLAEARQLLEAALATHMAAADVGESALVRRALCNADWLLGAVDAEERLRESEIELAGLNLAVPPLVHVEERVETGVQGVNETTSLDRLLVPLQRLTTRGLGVSYLHKEIVSITAQLFPGKHVVLSELTEAGNSTELAVQPGKGVANLNWFELEDGLGRVLRLGVGEVNEPGARSLLEAVAACAGMALEIAALRSMAVAAPRRSESIDSVSLLANVVAASPAMIKLKAELMRLSASRATIIITGESGTGKEVIARAIHDLSRRAGKPYVTFNSAAVPRDLFEGQLFGYRKGAFTGAHADHPGVIRAAEGGTLFLDEVGELPLDVQPKLLRFLENAEIYPLGAASAVKVDVRVIAATHRDLLALVAKGSFREDLYYRLQVVPVDVPPLRQRRDDIPALAKHFIRQYTPEDTQPPVLTRDGEARLVKHDWPGNVRELRNVIERTMAFEPLPRAIGAAELRL
jgi:tetratricopeptide (TPR) repeat protein